MFNDITSDDKIQNETDRLGGGGVLESGLYPATIKMAYGIKADSGAKGVVIQAETDQGRKITETIYVTSGTAKGGKNYYEKDGQKHYLPGYLIVNSLCLLAAGKELSEIDVEEKVIKVYDFDAKAEVPQKKPVLMDLINKPILLGVIKQTVDKNVKDASGAYVPSGETREVNTIDKAFRASDRMTTAEIRAQATEASFVDSWAKKNTGVTQNRATGAAGTAGASKATGGAAAGGTAKPKSSLFA